MQSKRGRFMKIEAVPSFDAQQSVEFLENGIKFNEELVSVMDSGIKQESTNIHVVLSADDMEIVGELGKGACSLVLKAVHKQSGTICALKGVNVYDSHKRSQFVRELKSLLQCSCPYLVKFYGAYWDVSMIRLALEFMDLGSIADFIKRLKAYNPNYAIPERVIAAMAMQMLMGLHYLHKERHQIHRDIKPENILINSSGSVKLNDFGISKDLLSTGAQATTFVGTTLYLSPERMNGQPYSYDSDIWAIGLVLYELCMGVYPYSSNQNITFLELLNVICNSTEPTLPAHFSHESREFVSLCIRRDPQARATASQLLDHPFIVNNVRDEDPAAIVFDFLQSL